MRDAIFFYVFVVILNDYIHFTVRFKNIFLNYFYTIVKANL